MVKVPEGLDTIVVILGGAVSMKSSGAQPRDFKQMSDGAAQARKGRRYAVRSSILPFLQQIKNP
jgi:hypothetical protein